MKKLESKYKQLGRQTKNKMRSYGHVLRMNKDGIPKKVLNMKVKCPRGKLRTRWEQQVRKDVTWKERRKTMGRN
jgi:hypothetical protein